MKDALWVTGRHGGIDPLDAATPPIGFSYVLSFYCLDARLADVQFHRLHRGLRSSLQT